MVLCASLGTGLMNQCFYSLLVGSSQRHILFSALPALYLVFSFTATTTRTPQFRPAEVVVPTCCRSANSPDLIMRERLLCNFENICTSSYLLRGLCSHLVME